MKVLLVDDDALVCAALKTILCADGGITVCATGTSGEEAVALYARHLPDVLLMDIRMEGMDGIAAGKAILARHSGARIIYLTTFLDDEYVIKALAMGARGYILKQDFESVTQALYAAMAGQSVFGREIASRIPAMLRLDNSGGAKALGGITQKEREIVKEVAAGLTNRQIAEKLYLSEGTVRNYISAILEKLELRHRTQLAVYYYTGVKPK